MTHTQTPFSEALAAIDARLAATLALMTHLAVHHEQMEPVPPESETPPAQTTAQPYDPSEWYTDPQTGAVYNPTTGEAFNPTTGEPVPFPAEPDVFIDF